MLNNNPQSNREKLLNVSEVAEILNVSKAFVYKLVGTGELRSIKIGTAIRVRRVDFDNYILNCLSPSKLEEYLD